MKKFLSLLTALLLLMGLIPAALAEEPIVITGMILKDAILPDASDNSVLDYIEEQTGIRVEITEIADVEKMGLIFTSQEFPDFFMNTGLSDDQLILAAEDGAIIPLDDLIEQYAPTWKAFLESDPVANTLMRFPDGKLYALPTIDYSGVERNLRDQWCINEAWLKELNLAYPTTIDEYTEVLRAIKAAAGTGTIPENVIPYFFRMDQWVNGQYDLYACFGVYVSDENMMTVEDGQVVYQGVNEKLKPALQYLRDLYAEGLITPDCFTADSNTYRSITTSTEPMVGAFHAFHNTVPDKFTALAPLLSEYCENPYIRRQLKLQTSKPFMITSACEHPEVVMQLAEWIAATPENTYTVAWGRQGIFWDYNEEGKIYKLIEQSDPEFLENSKDFGYHNRFINLRDDAFYANYDEVTREEVNSRAWAYYNVYEDCLPPEDMLYVGAPLETDKQDRLLELQTDLNTYRTTTFSNWIAGNGDIEAEWDAYIQQCEAIGLAEYIELRTEAYNLIYNP